ncbi:YqgQ family protein [Polycladomyces subterraneus]|uniref:YqgQ family protein n=1 Tax=Polycladomyces subterraneus TaxID=1016997 RepID=A0ABT8ILV2_9BACL|nr:YqgQ family protein [Polycladomyces subterraneus]MDN4593763.1 YqgQ family protein [Polycladomyces subterraneus]
MEASIRTMSDVRALLKRFGAIIYTGDELGDLDLMEDELAELHHWGMIETSEYMAACMVIRQRRMELDK